VESAPLRAASARRWLPIALGSALICSAVGGYVVYRQLHRHVPGQVPLAPVDPDELSEDALALTGKNPGSLVQLLAASPEVEAFARRVAGAQSTPEAKAKAICDALGQRRAKQAFVAWPRVEAREGSPLTASETLAAIEHDGARKQLYPLEVAALAVASLRSLSVPALVAEVYRYPNEQRALDPSGRLGYHAVALPAEGNAARRLFDPYGGRTSVVAASDYRVLNDAQVLGAAFALRAVSQLDQVGNPTAGLADAELAIKLAPSSPSVRSVRAALLLASGGIEAGTHELDAALQLRSDAPRRNNLATLGLLSGSPDAAAKEVAAALAEAPDYALAHVTLATVHLMRGERDLARAELEKAEQLEPDLALLPQIWAQFYATTNEFDRALAKAEEGVRRRPKDTQARLVLARIDHATGRYDDMRKQAAAILAYVPADQQSRVRDLLRSMLGPTVFEDANQDGARAEHAEGDDADDQHTASTSPGSGPSSPRLLDPSAGGVDLNSPSLQLRPGSPKLQLGAGDSNLKLKLQP
jgi:Tfp pilus assembly protein PilF